MLQTINNLPNRNHPFMKSEYCIYVLDDYAVHLQDEVREALLKRGYILVLIGGGVTGDIQINDTHMHSPLKTNYSLLESSLMVEKLDNFPGKCQKCFRHIHWSLMDMTFIYDIFFR